jgi:hypothetical protein
MESVERHVPPWSRRDAAGLPNRSERNARSENFTTAPTSTAKPLPTEKRFGAFSDYARLDRAIQ